MIDCHPDLQAAYIELSLKLTESKSLVEISAQEVVKQSR